MAADEHDPTAPMPKIGDGAVPKVGDIADANTELAPLVDESLSGQESGFAMSAESLGAVTENDLDAEAALGGGAGVLGPGAFPAYAPGAVPPAPRSSDTQPMQVPPQPPRVQPAITATLLPDGAVMAEPPAAEASTDHEAPQAANAPHPDGPQAANAPRGDGPQAANAPRGGVRGTLIVGALLAVVAVGLFLAAWLVG